MKSPVLRLFDLGKVAILYRLTSLYDTNAPKYKWEKNDVKMK